MRVNYFVILIALCWVGSIKAQDSQQRMGINTETPEKTLHIKGAMRFQDIKIDQVDKLGKGEPFQYLIKLPGSDKIVPATSIPVSVEPDEIYYDASIVRKTVSRGNGDDYFSSINTGFSWSDYYISVIGAKLTTSNGYVYNDNSYADHLFPYVNTQAFKNGSNWHVYLDYPMFTYKGRGSLTWEYYLLVIKKRKQDGQLPDVYSQTINMNRSATGTDNNQTLR